ncbi:MAG: PKD domain-containing protein [Saccharospirillaceae bacterium]|nr:PKD domain-containing protein [Saccharospirillaceae bacterium]
MRFLLGFLVTFTLLSCTSDQNSACLTSIPQTINTTNCLVLDTQLEITLPDATFELTQISPSQINVSVINPKTNHTYQWDFGDKTTTQDQANYIYSYTAAGDFNVSLTVSNSDGFFDFATVLIKNINEAPSINFVTRYEPLKLILNAQSQSETLSELTYLWTIEGNETAGESIEYILDNPGQVEVKLSVTDIFGISNTISKTLNVTDSENTAPQGYIVVYQDNHLVKLIGSNSFDTDKDHLTYQWEFEGKVISTQAQFYYEFSTAGNHLIKLNVFDGEISTAVEQMISVIDSQKQDYDLILFQTSKEIISTCSSCHDDGILHITDYKNLSTLADDLKDYIRSRSAKYPQRNKRVIPFRLSIYSGGRSFC